MNHRMRCSGTCVDLSRPKRQEERFVRCGFPLGFLLDLFAAVANIRIRRLDIFLTDLMSQNFHSP